MKRLYNNGSIEKYFDNEVDIIPGGYVHGKMHRKTRTEINADNISKEALIDYYFKNNKADTAEHFNITSSELTNLISFYNIVKPKTLCVSKVNTRSHESYVNGGKKSAATQKKHWEEKSDAAKAAWSEKQKEAHSTSEFREAISKINKEYQASLPKEKKAKLNKKRSESYTAWWYENFTEEERKEKIKISLEHGAGWNHNKIKGSNSKPNLLFKDLLISAGLYNSDEDNREFVLGNYSYDFKVGNNLIEINPYATHNSSWGIFDREGLDKKYHHDKSQLAEKSGYRCIHVFDWDDPDKIISLLKPRKRVYARNCEVREVDKDSAKDYINTWHLQGYSRDDIRLGLYYDNELVSIMTFGKPRYNRNYEYELIRYCAHYQVVGGAEKLFKYFINNYSSSIISYCDISKFSGNVYRQLGFKLERLNIGRHWYNPKTNEHITDNLLRQRGFDQLFGTSYGKGTSNEELMLNTGFVKIYDTGQATYLYLNNKI